MRSAQSDARNLRAQLRAARNRNPRPAHIALRVIALTSRQHMPESERLSSGVPGLDERLGGGLIPGTLTVVLGATGIGKTQLGIQFAAAGRTREGTPGVIFDMTARLDSQNHADYANRIAD